VLTSHPAETSSASWSVARLGAALSLSVVTLTSSYAGTVVDLSCIGGAKSFNCVAQMATAGDPYVRVVPQVLGEAQKSQLAARDRKWVAHCHPVAERDSYGVARYRYAAAGCEYGLGTD
jgi:hypothetical protein